jgi:putative tricarboxylic transport membrane protein
MMLRKDLISSLFWIASGALIILGSLRLPLGGPQNPGPGFLPFLVGVLMLILSVALLVRSVHFKGGKRTEPAAVSSKSFKLIGTAAALFLFAFAFPHLGFLITTIPLMIFLSRVIGELNWRVSLAIGFLTSLAMYALFKTWLKVQFPVGPWGF